MFISFFAAAAVAFASSPFTEAQIASGEFVEAKNAEWQACHRSSFSPELASAGQSTDDLADFLETGARNVERNLARMDARGLKSGKVKKQPWSGDFWPYSKGILGSRALDPDFLNLGTWLARFEFVTKAPAAALLKERGAAALAVLSPSEKYDLLTGDESGSLTGVMWSEGKRYYDESGKVEEWMGICHGWAPASIVEPRPSRALEVPSLDEKWNIPLNPSELKGLISYSWATNPYAVKTLGKRCNKRRPQRDRNGRLTDPECFDLNPATWHAAVVNRVGAAGESFVLDATFDFEVWNQPMLAYSYAYFNPQTGKPGTLKEAAIERSRFKKDPYAKYRPASARFIVGIAMKVAYVVETRANALSEDSESGDSVIWTEYVYDLELDERGNAVGGEWRGPFHPDFIWRPAREARPRSPVDRTLQASGWNAGGKLPASWAAAARIGSSFGLISDYIAKSLVERAAAAR